MKYNPEIWGPHYWFVLHTIAHSYPLYPNDVTKRKYYDFIHNLPLFIPNEEIGNEFSRLLDKYPVSPYLDKRSSFIRWMNFIHNKVNVVLGKEEISLDDAIEIYKKQYKPDSYLFFHDTTTKIKKVYVNITIISILLITIFCVYRKSK